MDIGSRIKALRLEHSLSQEELGAKLHVTRQTVSNWENNKNYPDLATLVELTELFDVTFDEVIKEDPAFVRVTDENKKRVAKGRRWIWILLIIILLMLLGMAWFLTHVGIGTDDGERIKSETRVKMAVNLPGQTPSRAITRTYTADDFDALSELDQIDKLAETTGNVEGDIPCTRIDKREKSEICFVFQDIDYNDIEPAVKSVILFTSPGLPPEIEKRTDKKFDYHYEDGRLQLYASDFLEEEELIFGEYMVDDEKFVYVMVCYFLIRYVYEGEEYVSVTAVNALPM